MEIVNSSAFISLLSTEFSKYKNEQNGLSMSKYMKDRFLFYGIKAADRKQIQKVWLSNLPKQLSHEQRWEILIELWEKDQREYQYVAIDWLNSWKKEWIHPEDIKHLRWLIENKTWWDSVDAIASNYLGKFAKKFPETTAEFVEEWRNESNFWLNRSCLIFQLKFKQEVDFKLLKGLILQFQSNKEFFIQKAIGWSLRQYSKFEPKQVLDFVNKINLTGLAKREATKYL
jgi:3-methyladenine DNA glycosylase AlkD